MKQGSVKYPYLHGLPSACFEVVFGTILLVFIRIKYGRMVFFLQILVCDRISFCTFHYFSPSLVGYNSAPCAFSQIKFEATNCIIL